MKRNCKWSATTGAEQASRAERRPGRAAPTSGSGLTASSECSVSGLSPGDGHTVSAEATRGQSSWHHITCWSLVTGSPVPSTPRGSSWHEDSDISNYRECQSLQCQEKHLWRVWCGCVQSYLINIFHWKEFRDFLMLHPLCIDPIHSSTMAMTYLQVKNNFHT